MTGHDIIVIGASAGGVEGLQQIVADLPEDLPAAIFIVIHSSPQHKSTLPDLLNRRGSLRAAHGSDNELILYGRIYVALPDYHLLVKRDYIRLVHGPKENHTRPAIDPLFRTAAKAYGRRVVGVVLSGMLDDGTAGLFDIKRLGGVAIVQDPHDTLYSSMPRNAIEHVKVDHILPLSAIAPMLVRLAHEPVVDEGVRTVSNDSNLEIEMEPDIVELDGQAMRKQGRAHKPAGFSCPDCGGTLRELTEREGVLQFRCRVGHSFSAASLVAMQSEAQEEALWAAVRSLEERSDLLLRMAEKARERNQILSAERYEAQAQEARQRADLAREALFQGQLPATAPKQVAQVAQEAQAYNPLLPFPNAAYNVVVFVAADGGIEAFSQILRALPQTFPAAVIVLQKIDLESLPNLVDDASSRPTTLPLKQAQAQERLQPAIVYVAPPNQHLLVNPDGTFSLTQAVLIGLPRPSADLLLQSVAATFQQRAIAVVLSGSGSDGATGVQAIHQMGGKVIAQDESTAEFFELPNAAIQTGTVDLVLPLSAIAPTLEDLVKIIRN